MGWNERSLAAEPPNLSIYGQGSDPLNPNVNPSEPLNPQHLLDRIGPPLRQSTCRTLQSPAIVESLMATVDQSLREQGMRGETLKVTQQYLREVVGISVAGFCQSNRSPSGLSAKRHTNH